MVSLHESGKGISTSLETQQTLGKGGGEGDEAGTRLLYNSRGFFLHRATCSNAIFAGVSMSVRRILFRTLVRGPAGGSSLAFFAQSVQIFIYNWPRDGLKMEFSPREPRE